MKRNALETSPSEKKLVVRNLNGTGMVKRRDKHSSSYYSHNSSILRFSRITDSNLILKEQRDKRFWHQFLNSKTIEGGMALVKRERPYEFIKLHSKLVAALVAKLGRCTRAISYSNWKLPFVDFYGGRTLVFVGADGIGKTNFALAHFENALLVSARQDFAQATLYGFPYDGVVIEGSLLRQWDALDVKRITDTEFDATVEVARGIATLRAGLRQIIVSSDVDSLVNPDWSEDTKLAIRRRCCLVMLGEQPLYWESPAAAANGEQGAQANIDDRAR